MTKISSLSRRHWRRPRSIDTTRTSSVLLIRAFLAAIGLYTLAALFMALTPTPAIAASWPSRTLTSGSAPDNFLSMPIRAMSRC